MSKRLTPVQAEEMKKMVVKGVAPEDIANHFGIAISSVHNYKKRFKDEGVEFPSVKGKRPAGQVQKPAGTVKGFRYTEKTISAPTAQARNMPTASSQHLRVIVNGVSVEVAAGAKSVNINNGQIEVKY